MKNLRKLVGSLIPNSLIVRRLPKTDSKQILITFDDGPCEVNTLKVLEILKKYDVKAMFFVVGHRIEKAPKILKMIADEGHLLCNHSYSHNPTSSINPVVTFRDIKKCGELINLYSGTKSSFYRPPCGKLNFYSLLSSLILKQKIVFWSVEVQDWRCKSKQEAIKKAKKIIDNVKKGDIILLHDDHNYIFDVLEVLLPYLKVNYFNCDNKI